MAAVRLDEDRQVQWAEDQGTAQQYNWTACRTAVTGILRRPGRQPSRMQTGVSPYGVMLGGRLVTP